MWRKTKSGKDANRARGITAQRLGSALRHPEAGHPDDVEMYSMETVRYRLKLRQFLRY